VRVYCARLTNNMTFDPSRLYQFTPQCSYLSATNLGFFGSVFPFFKMPFTGTPGEADAGVSACLLC